MFTQFHQQRQTTRPVSQSPRQRVQKKVVAESVQVAMLFVQGRNTVWDLRVLGMGFNLNVMCTAKNVVGKTSRILTQFCL